MLILTCDTHMQYYIIRFIHVLWPENLSAPYSNPPYFVGYLWLFQATIKLHKGAGTGLSFCCNTCAEKHYSCWLRFAHATSLETLLNCLFEFCTCRFEPEITMSDHFPGIGRWAGSKDYCLLALGLVLPKFCARCSCVAMSGQWY